MDEGRIEDIFNMVRRGEGTSGIGKVPGKGHQVSGNAINNISTVLMRADPFEHFSDPAVWKAGDVLSGLKVDPFFTNVIGDLARYTNDTHMLKYGPAMSNSLSRRAGMGAAVGAGASKLADDLALPARAIEMAEGQSMAWEPIRQLYEMSGRGSKSIEDLLFLPDGTLNMDTIEELGGRMRRADDFSQLLQTEEAGQMIARAGGNPNINVPPRAGLQPFQEEALQYALDRPESLRRASRRMDMWAEGDPMFGIGALGAGVAARQGGLLSPQKEEEPPALFRGQGLLGYNGKEGT